VKRRVKFPPFTILKELKGIEFIIYCMMIGASSMYLQELYKPNMIFDPYYRWLKSRSTRKHFSIYNPMGLNVYDQNFWINFLVYGLYFGRFDGYFLLSIGGTYFSIEIIKLVKRWNT